tara:strand:- start:455 stop:1027 length:573 start_codon:yes stop_codon:yes gene_type:complete
MVGGTGYQIEQQWLGGPQVLVNTATGERQDVIGYDDANNPVVKQKSDSPWMAWVPSVYALDQDGKSYQPYTKGIPYTLEGGSVVKWNPTDSQALAYLDSAPGAGAREAYQERTCSPLWSNVFGCKEGNQIWIPNETIAEHESVLDKIKSLFGSEEYKADFALSVSWKGILTLLGSLAVIGIVGKRIIKEE